MIAVRDFSFAILCFLLKLNFENLSRVCIFMSGNSFFRIFLIVSDPNKIVSLEPLKFNILSVNICTLS